MGLHCSHDCYSGGYGKFHHFRKAVAEVVGIPLDVMEGFFDRDEWLVCAFEEAGKSLLESRLKALPVSWKAFEQDPICQFLHHSDCDGEIPWEDAVKIAERLEQIAPQIVRPPDMRDDWNFKESAMRFAEGLRLAAERKENVTFG